MPQAGYYGARKPLDDVERDRPLRDPLGRVSSWPRDLQRPPPSQAHRPC